MLVQMLGADMRRRTVLAGLGGVIAALAPRVHAQSASVRRLGLLMTIAESEPEAQARLEALRGGLQALGWSEGRNIRIDYRFAAGEPDRLRAIAADLVSLGPDVILANGRAILAAMRQETKSIPVVFVAVPDPVGDGFITSLAKPGGNLTGITNFEYSMGGKWVELLKEIAPNLRNVALLHNPDSAPYASNFQKSAALGADASLAPVKNNSDIERVFTSLVSQPNSGIIVVPDLFTSGHREIIVNSASSLRIPAIYPFRFFISNGGLLCYGVETVNLFRQSASFIDRILKGERAADLPVQAPNKFELVINLKTAKLLGLTVPATLLARADEVIE
jgi:putative tryptophan/tyrosine transport system substrate-binding protein